MLYLPCGSSGPFKTTMALHLGLSALPCVEREKQNHHHQSVCTKNYMCKPIQML